ncbi:MAG: class I SAM-dependent methyltransferase [Opitutales bacterium]
MKLESTRKHWNRLAETDPLWAVLTAPGKKGNRWQLEEFLAGGRAEVAAQIAVVRRLHPALGPGAALDFGCGVGRLSQGLAEHFGHVTGLDISEKMLELARRYNRHGDRVRYVHNTHPDLRDLASNQFDFVYSLITLQHMEPAYARGYIAEFVRVAAPGGAILFQIPAAIGPPPFTLWPDTLVKRLLRKVRILLGLDSVIEMHALPRAEVEAELRAAGAEIIDVYRYNAAGPGIESWCYLARKP